MSNDSDQAWQGHSPVPSLAAPRRRWPWALLLLIILALAGAGGVYAWPELAMVVPSLGREAPGKDIAAADKETPPDLLARHQKVEADLAVLGKAVADQQEQLKTIVDQLAALTSKVDALQHSAPAPAPPTVAAEPPRAPIAQAAPKPRKPPPHAAKPAGPISTGGAPLN